MYSKTEDRSVEAEIKEQTQRLFKEVLSKEMLSKLTTRAERLDSGFMKALKMVIDEDEKASQQAPQRRRPKKTI
ncbi:MAG: hypothetical protein HW421_1437 [Ignavibacteria bacterium]|nr:hypothetical protein [Ignavibacteria bacterium]